MLSGNHLRTRGLMVSSRAPFSYLGAPMPNRSFKPLIVLELANNHMGSFEHGVRVLSAFAAAVAPFRERFDFAFKLQYRHLDSFIHPEFKGRADVKYVRRFEETRLTEAQYRGLRNTARDLGFLAVCTPFDETSVALVEAHEFDRMKIASCSLGDWPLMERMARSRIPIIASTAGSELDVLDRVVSFFDHRGRALTIMHCVAEYPTPTSRLHLSQLDLLRARYPKHEIGFSTHEEPSNTRVVQMALAKGATVLEKHVGVATPDWPLNAYSTSPEQLVPWLEAASEALDALGEPDTRYQPSQTERDSLHSLRRGVFVTEAIDAGHVIDPAKVMLAIPTVPGQLTANDLSKFSQHIATEPIAALGAVLLSRVRKVDTRARVAEIAGRVRTLLLESHATLSPHTEVEISHHYGLDRFEEVGATIVNVVNREYCKKLIALLPGQRHPEQHHKQKEETFHVLYGSLQLTLDGVAKCLQTGEIVTVERGVHHEFWSETGTVFEEISSTHYKDDSFYTDPAIAENPHRKTLLAYFFG